MALLDLLLPPACAGCRSFGHLFCETCRLSLRPASHPADRFFAPDTGVVVGRDLRLGTSAFIYEGAIRRALQALKYGRAGRVARPLAQAAAPSLLQLLDQTGPLVAVPVPLHVERQRERGYNQALLLAVELGRGARLEVRDVLVRGRGTVKQHKLDRAGRLRNLEGAFSLRDGRRPPTRVLLIDDIMTTSATLESCAGALVAAGAEEVYGFTIAREV